MLYVRLKQGREKSAHKSFQLTRQRDTPKKPLLESYAGFTWNVWKQLWACKGLVTRFVVVFTLVSALLVGIAQGNNLATVNELVHSVEDESSSPLDPLAKAAAIVTSGLVGSLNAGLSDIQLLYMSGLYIFSILVVIWLLRHAMAGNDKKLRDGIYNAGAPLASIAALVVVGLLQLIPVALVVLVYATANSSGLLSGGIDTGLFTLATGLVGVVTLYFMTTTVFALMVATVPGTYPLRAYSIAKQIVAGQRMRLLFRLLWLAVTMVVAWYLVLIPVAVITNALGASNSPVVPVAIQLMTGLGIVYGTTYCYMLYRRMIHDPVA